MNRRHDEDKPSERSTVSYIPLWQAGRDDSTADNETCSRPPTDLRGNPAAHVTHDAAEL